MSYSGGVSASLVLAAALSEQLGKRLAYMDIRSEAIDFPFQAGDAALIVADDIYTGGRIRKMRRLLEERQVEVFSPPLTVGNFYGSQQLDGLPIFSLIARPIETWPSASCPLCHKGSPALSGRRDWIQLIQS